MTKPTKEEIESFIREGDAFQENYEKRVYAPLSKGTNMVVIPDIPPHFIEFMRRLVAVFPSQTFLHFERAIADPGDPDMSDILKDLYRAQRTI